MTQTTSPLDGLAALAGGDRPVLETLTQMTVDTYERSGLSPQAYALVRIAALVAEDAAPISYALNLGTAAELGLTVEDVRGVLVAIAPVVGTARIASAAGKMIAGLGLADVLLDEEDEEA